MIRPFAIPAILTLILGCSDRPPDAAPPDSGEPPGLGAAISQVAGDLASGIASQDARDASNPYLMLEDPCILLGRADVEPVLGSLAADPHRASTDRAPDPRGSSCLYRAASGQSISLTPTYSGGALALRVMSRGAALADLALGDASGLADTLATEFDEVRWLSPATLLALTGDVLLEVDVANSTAGVVGAAELADRARRRLPSPLDYDGAAAARRTTAWRVEPQDPCGFLSAADVEAVIGPLSGQPERVGSDSCRYPRPKRGLTNQSVEFRFVWGDGVAKVNQSMAAGGGVGRFVEREKAALPRGDRSIDALKRDPNFQQILGVVGVDTSQISDLTTVDTTRLEGPWEAAAALPGELTIARNGIAATIVAPSRAIARRLAEQLGPRLIRR